MDHDIAQEALDAALEASRSRATVRAYSQAWRAFSDEAGDDALPAEPRIVALYLARIGVDGSPSTVRVHAAAIAAAHKEAGHPSPTEHPTVKAAIAGISRRSGTAPKQCLGIDEKAWEAITERAMEPRVTRGGRLETEEEAQFRGLVDVCLIGIMRDAMLRRSEAAALRWRDLTIAGDGTGRLILHRSKTDQEGQGTILYIGAEVCECLQAMRLITERQLDDRMFELSPSQICRRIARAARHAGLEGHYAGHSPRIGMAQDLAQMGATLPALMTAGRWKSARMPSYYTRNQTAGRGAVAQFYERKVN